MNQKAVYQKYQKYKISALDCESAFMRLTFVVFQEKDLKNEREKNKNYLDFFVPITVY